MSTASPRVGRRARPGTASRGEATSGWLFVTPTIVILGLFLLVVNAVLLAITAGLSDRLNVDGFVGAVVGGFLIALFSWAAELVLPLKVRG